MLRVPAALPFILALIVSTTSFAQPNIGLWHFGEGVQIDLTSGTAVVGTSAIDCGDGITPSSIADDAGNLVCFTEGTAVYNALGLTVTNGDFSNVADESILIPFPGDSDKFYVVRSGGWGVDYSVVDFSDGTGAIDDTEKEIELMDVRGHLLCANKAIGEGKWLMSVDNFGSTASNIRVNVFEVGAGGITLQEQQDQYYLWADFNGFLDDARLSPDCSTIAVSFKGHYIALMKFDNETGEVFDFLADAVNTPSSFFNVTYLDFSPGGEYIYAVGEQNIIRRYDYSSWDAATILGTGVEIESTGDQSWEDIKRGTDGRMYLLNNATDQLDVINAPDEGAEEVDFQYGLLDIDGITTHFPNTPNLLCTTVFDLAINHQYVCLGDSTELWYSYPIELDSVAWNFNDPSTGAQNISLLDQPIHVFSAPGDYDVELTTWFEGVSTVYNHSVTIYNQPNTDLGDDFTACAGSNITLDAGEAGYVYDWSTGANTQSIQVSETGEYWVEVNNFGCIDADTVSVTVIPFVTVEVSEDISLCNDDPVPLYVTMTGQTDYIWNNGVESEVIYVDESSEYWVTASNSCFTETDTVTVQLVSLPGTLLPGDFVACIGDTVSLTSVWQEGIVSWNTQEISATIDISETGTYSVFVEYMGCTTEDEVFVEFLPFVPMDHVFMPNVFSPDDRDALNPRFRPFLDFNKSEDICGYNTLDVDLRVYNRWGNLISSNSCYWDGRSETGEPMAEGVYYYIVDLHSTCMDRDERKQVDGHISLLR